MKHLRNKSLTFIELVLVVSFVAATVLLALGGVGQFSRLAVALLVATLVFLIIWHRKKIIWPGKVLWVFALVPATALGFMLLRGFFIGDVYYHWLPFAKVIVETGFLPDFVNFNWFSVMPLQSLLFAATFSLFGTFSQFANLWVPLFFTSAP